MLGSLLGLTSSIFLSYRTPFFFFFLLWAGGLLSQASTDVLDYSYGLLTILNALVFIVIPKVLVFFFPLNNSP